MTLRFVEPGSVRSFRPGANTSTATYPTGTAGPRITIPVGFMNATKKLASFLDLRPGWDSYRAPPPNNEAFIGAVVVLGYIAGGGDSRVFDVLHIAASLDGGVALAFEAGARALEITVTNHGIIKLERSDGGRFVRASEFARVPVVVFGPQLDEAFTWLFAN